MCRSASRCFPTIPVVSLLTLLPRLTSAVFPLSEEQHPHRPDLLITADPRLQDGPRAGRRPPRRRVRRHGPRAARRRTGWAADRLRRTRRPPVDATDASVDCRRDDILRDDLVPFDDRWVRRRRLLWVVECVREAAHEVWDITTRFTATSGTPPTRRRHRAPRASSTPAARRRGAASTRATARGSR